MHHPTDISFLLIAPCGDLLHLSQNIYGEDPLSPLRSATHIDKQNVFLDFSQTLLIHFSDNNYKRLHLIILRKKRKRSQIHTPGACDVICAGKCIQTRS